MAQRPDYYRVLNVARDAEDVAVQAVYRSLLKKYHPDVFKGSQAEANRKTKELNEAYEVLGDAASRAEYDAELKREAEAAARARAGQGARQTYRDASASGADYHADRAGKQTDAPPQKPKRVRVGVGKDLLKVGLLIAVGLFAIHEMVVPSSSPTTDNTVETPKEAPAPQAPIAQHPALPGAQTPAQLPAPRADQLLAPEPSPEATKRGDTTVPNDDDAGIPQGRIFRPHDRFTIATTKAQPIGLRGQTVGETEPGREYPVDEIYQDAPTSFTIFYHVPGGWVRGRLDENQCTDSCNDAWPAQRSADDAALEDAFLLDLIESMLVPLRASPIEFQPGDAQVAAKCNIIGNPITVNRKHRDALVGYSIRNGIDTNLLPDQPTLDVGETVRLTNMEATTSNATWLYVLTTNQNVPNGRGWVSTACLASNTQG